MKRFISRLLILSLLTLNIAWAADACALTGPAESMHASNSLQAEDPTPVDPAAAGLACDDWCHAWVGHIAVIDASPAFTPESSSFLVVELSDRYASLRISPPFHPPII